MYMRLTNMGTFPIILYESIIFSGILNGQNFPMFLSNPPLDIWGGGLMDTGGFYKIPSKTIISIPFCSIKT